MNATPRVTPEEFAAQFAREARLHWCIAAAIAGRTLAEDILQEAAVIALEKLEDFTPGTNLRAWFAQIVTNVARNVRRKELATGREDSATLPARHENGSMPIAGNGHLQADQHAFDDRVVHALAELSDDARACLLLRSVLELSYAEIAVTLAIPENTAMSHVHRARATLRERLPDSMKQLR